MEALVLLPWLQRQLMGFALIHTAIRERQRESCSAVPGGPVVHIVRTEKLAGFAQAQRERGGVKVGAVNGHALRRAKVAAYLLDGVYAAGLPRAYGRAR